MTIQVIGTYDISSSIEDGQNVIFLTHTGSIKDRDLDNRTLDMKMVGDCLHVLQEAKTILIYPAFPADSINLDHQLYILDFDPISDAATAIRGNMVSDS